MAQQKRNDYMREYMRKRRAEQRGTTQATRTPPKPAVAVVAPGPGSGQRPPQTTVTALKPPVAPPVETSSVPAGPGPCEQAVLRKCEGLSTAASNPDLVEAALAMARILDDHRLATTQPSAAAKLHVIMADLKRGAETRRGRLSSIEQKVRAV